MTQEAMPDGGSREAMPALSAVAVAVRDFMHASRELTNRVARQAGRSATDTTALGLLDMLGPLSPVELAAHLGISTASATVLVDRLERAGHVHRERHASDRRRILVHLDDGTRDRERQVWGPIVTDIDQAARSLSPHQQEAVAGYLAQLTGLLTAHPHADAQEQAPAG